MTAERIRLIVDSEKCQGHGRCYALAPDLFDAVALLHPLIPFEPEVIGSLSGRKVLITAGRRDPICPPQMTSRLDAYLRADGADVTLDWHEGGHELRPNEVEAARKFFSNSNGKQSS